MLFRRLDHPTFSDRKQNGAQNGRATRARLVPRQSMIGRDSAGDYNVRPVRIDAFCNFDT